ncbi:Prolyl 4-hydroxylase alpha subunit [Arabidopsis thaliana x Arabidopsis arenosa]|uniref:Prolyl 4-hydroxylase alpha subunit n=1 Tax=Arabidopsis thaliana x Arabidopsis arenosa TaxID=1240361 RepID=A0A8T2C5C3_9BRAS|nr:Prolyl 4-hydroxylase alpha subunit [Arabidopsis thaliana x Arabidopsis arenosa]
MAVDGDGTVGGGDSQPPVTVTTAAATTEMAIARLSRFPNMEHISDSYDDLKLEFSSSVLRSLEKYLPPEMLRANREAKAKFMSDILRKYISREECSKANWRKTYLQRIKSNYQPLCRDLYNFDPELFLLPSFRKAISDNTEESFRRIISEPFPGVFVFQIFQPDFFQKLIVEVENIKKWAHEKKFQIRRPYHTSRYGVVLDDFGLDIMLKQLMENFIFPVCKVFFPEVCGTMFDSHHGFIVENGADRDAPLDHHIDDSEITLNVCVRRQYEGGEISFIGTRCVKHMRTNIKPEEVFHYCHTLGQAILHRGRHRHGPRTTTNSCSRGNMILCCRNSLFREMETYEKEFPEWCGQCAHEKKEKESQSLAAKRKGMIRIEGGGKAR